MTTSFNRIIALPLLSAGILGGALGLIGTASASAATSTASSSDSAAIQQEKPRTGLTTNPWYKLQQYKETSTPFGH